MEGDIKHGNMNDLLRERYGLAVHWQDKTVDHFLRAIVTVLILAVFIYMLGVGQRGALKKRIISTTIDNSEN